MNRTSGPVARTRTARTILQSMRNRGLCLRFCLVACAAWIAACAAAWLVLPEESARVFLTLGAGILAAFLLLFLLLMKRYVREPLLGLVAYARDILEGRDVPAPEAGTGEILELSEAFLRMAEAIREREKALADIVKFTASNPNLVMKVDPDGRILFASQGVEQTLYGMGLPLQHSELLLPDDAGSIVREILGSEEKKRALTCEAEGRTIRYTLYGVEDEEAVVFHGVDVTAQTAELVPLSLPVQEKRPRGQ